MAEIIGIQVRKVVSGIPVCEVNPSSCCSGGIVSSGTVLNSGIVTVPSTVTTNYLSGSTQNYYNKTFNYGSGPNIHTLRTGGGFRFDGPSKLRTYAPFEICDALYYCCENYYWSGASTASGWRPPEGIPVWNIYSTVSGMGIQSLYPRLASTGEPTHKLVSQTNLASGVLVSGRIGLIAVSGNKATAPAYSLFVVTSGQMGAGWLSQGQGSDYSLITQEMNSLFAFDPILVVTSGYTLSGTGLYVVPPSQIASGYGSIYDIEGNYVEPQPQAIYLVNKSISGNGIVIGQVSGLEPYPISLPPAHSGGLKLRPDDAAMIWLNTCVQPNTWQVLNTTVIPPFSGLASVASGDIQSGTIPGNAILSGTILTTSLLFVSGSQTIFGGPNLYYFSGSISGGSAGAERNIFTYSGIAIKGTICFRNRGAIGGFGIRFIRFNTEDLFGVIASGSSNEFPMNDGGDLWPNWRAAAIGQNPLNLDNMTNQYSPPPYKSITLSLYKEQIVNITLNPFEYDGYAWLQGGTMSYISGGP